MRNYHALLRAPAGFLAPRGKKLQLASKTCRTLGALLVATIFLGACATQEVERPIAQMTRAETAIQTAIQAGAREAAPRDLQTAQSHFSQAQQASAEEDYLEAQRLAEKAEADAQVAEATARSEQTYETVAELRESIQALEEELERDDEQFQRDVN